MAAGFVKGRMGEEEYIAGKIARLDVDDDISASDIFMLELDDSSGTFHRMRYDAVLRYADKQQDNFHAFNLPSSPTCDPSHEEAVCFPLRDGANIFASTPERSRPDGSRVAVEEVGCADDVLVEEGSVDYVVVEEEGSADAPEEPCLPAAIGPKLYSLTKSSDWTVLKNGQPGWPVAPVLYTRGDELFSAKMDIEKVKGMMDANGDLRYSRIFDDLLPTVGGEHFYAYLAARARSYMTYLMVQCNIEVQRNWKPRYYKPDEGLIILTDYIARFYGCQLARSNNGFPSIDNSWSTRDPLEANGPLKECMLCDAFRDMYRYMLFNDDFDEESPDEWSDVYFDKKHSSPATARHRKKIIDVEDAICQRWKEYVNFGMWVTFDESRVAGWYNSAMTIGPELKPIRTGATIHSLCVSKGDLAGYKLHARTYGGA
jgi:hypothetical protein